MFSINVLFYFLINHTSLKRDCLRQLISGSWGISKVSIITPYLYSFFWNREFLDFTNSFPVNVRVNVFAINSG